MKWVYVPIMFLLAFAYTKISFNNFNPNNSTGAFLSARRPASAADIMPSPVTTKIPSAFFYKSLSTEDLSLFDVVVNYQGVVLGDSQVENFGFIIDDSKKISLGVVDSSEVTEGALYHDVLFHLISSKTLNKKIPWIDYFEAYKKGLRNESHIHSFYVEKGMSEAIINSEKFLESNMTSDFPFEFTKLKKTNYHLNAVDRSRIQNELQKVFPKIQFFDLYETSVKNKSYEALVRIRPQDKIQWISMKDNTLSDYDQLTGKTKGSPFVDRYEFIKKTVYSQKMNKSVLALEIDKRSYVLKFVEQFSSKLDFGQIPADDYHDIIMDEAYSLGQIHRESLNESELDEYIKAWATIPGRLIDEKAIELKYKIKDSLEK